MRSYHSEPEWTWERWQWRGTPHSLKLQNYWNFTIRLFSVISRKLNCGGGGLTPLQRSNWCILQPQLIRQFLVRATFSCYVFKYIWLYPILKMAGTSLVRLSCSIGVGSKVHPKDNVFFVSMAYQLLWVI